MGATFLSTFKLLKGILKTDIIFQPIYRKHPLVACTAHLQSAPQDHVVRQFWWVTRESLST